MSSNPFAKATKSKSKLRMALIGTSGSGKTYTALQIASALGKIAVIDTEHGSASKYAGLFDFDVLELSNFHPQRYIDAIAAAAEAGYEVVIIDSLSHAWSGTGGALELVDRATKQSQSKNSYMAWGEVTPLHNKLIEAMIGAPLHVIATMRSKTEYVLDRDEKTGKSTPRKVGLAPVQRDGMEYEFDVVGELDMSNTLVITKTRVPALAGAVIEQPDAKLGATLQAWLQDGVDAPPKPVAVEDEQQPASVRGAGIVKPQPQEEPDMRPPTNKVGSDESEVPLNLYVCDGLIVTQSKTARQYVLKVQRSATRIVVSDMAVFEGLTLGDTPVQALKPGEYPLSPAWTVYADTSPSGAWEILEIVTAIPV